MSNQSLRVVARLIANPDKILALKAVLTDIISPTRAEKGCLQYDLYQNRDKPTEFTFIEEWTSEAALAEHLASSHIQQGMKDIVNLVAITPDIQCLNRIL
jgi:quinol monooxygenase YgiN